MDFTNTQTRFTTQEGTADTSADSPTADSNTADTFTHERAILKDFRVINLAWFIDIKYRFWTPGEMIRVPKDQQAYYISVLHNFDNIARQIPPIPSDFHHDTSRFRCATDDEIDRWLLARQTANESRGIDALQAMMPSLWGMMDDRGRQNPSLNDAQIMQLLTSESAGIKREPIKSDSTDTRKLSQITAYSAADKKINKTPKKMITNSRDSGVQGDMHDLIFTHKTAQSGTRFAFTPGI
ncbi:hypothetical protein F5X68DRAFT_261222 [Plectosphaerella plurivora]|uniref:Uncharacterized protein n=1 Tax=Plectosphaerella plurivora TaxID=936078 RepID=A0A9P9ABG4_9PEZI|nr:hypothetical protein F5X68DRAFT_261222 [Plectosphaerella plurivora]